MGVIKNILSGRYRNITLQEENDFNITPPGLFIWGGEFPFKAGDSFPPEEVKNRASEYKTNKQLYENKFDDIMDNVFSWNDYAQNPVTNTPNMAIIADLPDFCVATESWVELIAAKHPKIIPLIYREETDEIIKLSSIVNNSNFATEFQDIIRCAYCMYGNKVVRVNKLSNGSVHIVNMPVKCWIPWLNKNDISVIDVNMFFNIIKTDNGEICQFINYYEDGTIEKRVFKYRSGVLGEEIEEPEITKAFDNSDMSPIVVFTGDHCDGSIYGNTQYKYWDASIAFAIRAYEALGVLIEQLKEIYRVLPDGTTRTDEDSGITFQTNTGAIIYKGNDAPGVSIIKASIQLDQALNTYTIALKRVAKDTGLPISYFDETNLGGKISADALRTSMFRSTLKADKIVSLFKNDIKRLIVRMALADGLEINESDFEVKFDTGFINDRELEMKLIQARSGNAITMTPADAIAAYDDVSISQAKKKADEILGIKGNELDDKEVESSDSGNSSEVDNGIKFEYVSQEVSNNDKPITESPIGLI